MCVHVKLFVINFICILNSLSIDILYENNNEKLTLRHIIFYAQSFS